MKTQMTSIFLGLSLVAASAYAAHAEETPLPLSNAVNVTAPDQAGTWSFGVTAVLLQPTNQPFIYAYQDASTDLDAPPALLGSDNSYTRLALNEGYSWWFGADVTYAFPGNGRDVILAYEGLHGTTTDEARNDFDNETAVGVTHGLVNNITGADVTYIAAAAKTQYDAGDLVFGQNLDVGSRVRLHPFIGLRYAHIDVKDSFEDTLDPFFQDIVSGNESGDLDSSFNGIGPRLGSDATFSLVSGFSIHGRLGLSALIGSQKYNANYTYTQVGFSPEETYTDNVILDDNSKTSVIPEADARLGLSYSHIFSTGMALGLEAGWQVTNYFGVIDNPYTDYVGSTTTPAREKYTDFGLQGPYGRIQLDIT